MEIKLSKTIEQIGLEVLNEHPIEFMNILNGKYKVAYLVSDQKKVASGGVVNAECSLIPNKYKWTCDYDFAITFYTNNIQYMDEEQLHILMLHELYHAGLDKDKPYIKPHDLVDFKKIVDKYGVDWSEEHE